MSICGTAMIYTDKELVDTAYNYHARPASPPE
jgi:hypothetical protein